MAVSVEKKYQKLTDTAHVLHRPGMYIGSIKPHTEEVYLFNEKKAKFEPTEITYNPGFIKLFDEIISNSVDEHKRNKNLNQIKVTIDEDSGRISIWDNGGIPVEIHKQYKEWIPEMIFSNTARKEVLGKDIHNKNLIIQIVTQMLGLFNLNDDEADAWVVAEYLRRQKIK